MTRKNLVNVVRERKSVNWEMTNGAYRTNVGKPFHVESYVWISKLRLFVTSKCFLCYMYYGNLTVVTHTYLNQIGKFIFLYTKCKKRNDVMSEKVLIK